MAVPKINLSLSVVVIHADFSIFAKSNQPPFVN